MEIQIQISESYEEKYERSKHSVGISMWHFEWCTKYRYQMFRKEEQRNLITACIRRVASMHEIKIIELNVQPEHVHCVVGIKLSMSPTHALQILKGGSAYLYFRAQEKARLRYPRGHLWSPGKFASSLGFIQLDTAKNYVRNQDIHHASYGSLAL
jgi:putative transposase